MIINNSEEDFEKIVQDFIRDGNIYRLIHYQ